MKTKGRQDKAVGVPALSQVRQRELLLFNCLAYI
jgi:hypothetical protein